MLRDVLVLDPRSVDAKELLATVLTGQDRYDEAIKIARETCESNGAAVSSQVVLAGVLSEAGCPDEALRVASAAADAAPQDARVHGALGAVYVKMNDGAAALASFERMAKCLAPETNRLPSSPWVSYRGPRGSSQSSRSTRRGRVGIRRSASHGIGGFSKGGLKWRHTTSSRHGKPNGTSTAAVHSVTQPRSTAAEYRRLRARDLNPRKPRATDKPSAWAWRWSGPAEVVSFVGAKCYACPSHSPRDGLRTPGAA